MRKRRVDAGPGGVARPALLGQIVIYSVKEIVIKCHQRYSSNIMRRRGGKWRPSAPCSYTRFITARAAVA